MIRIANGQGFWGDWLEAPVRLVEQGPIDYLTLDYLAEVTMSILQKQKQADPTLGYARDFPPLIARLASAHARARRQGDRQCRRRQSRRLRPRSACGSRPVSRSRWCSATTSSRRIDEFLAKGYEMRDMDTGEPLASIRDRILSANAYIGAFPLAEALATGADVVIAGRSTDTALTLAPMIHRFGWSAGRLRQARRRHHRRPHHRMRRAVHRRQLPGGLADHPRHGQHRLPHRRSRARRHASSSPSTPAPAAASRCDIVKEQLLYELGDPEELHHARLRRRFHHHPPRRRRPRPRARHRHPRRPAPAHR